MKKLIAITVLLTAIILSGCDQPAGDPDVDYEQAALGTWMMTLTASTPSAVVIEGPLTFHADGTATGEYGNVSGCSQGGCISTTVAYGSEYGYWSVEGNMITITAGNGMWGTFIDENNLSGTIIDTQGVSAAWTAYKISDLPDAIPEFNIVGDWMMDFEIDGIQRFQSFTVGENHLAEVTWVKYQDMTQPGNPITYEGVPGENDVYVVHVDGEHVTMDSVDGSLTLEGDAVYDEEAEVWTIEGTWTNNNDGSTGDWYVVGQG